MDGGTLFGRGRCSRCGNLKKEFVGFGTALKPATEIICLARKPLSEKTIAANVLKHGTGAINIDGCRVSTNEQSAERKHGGRVYEGVADGYKRPNKSSFTHKTDWHMPAQGRWPANVIHDGSEEVMAAFARSGKSQSRAGDRRGGCEFFMGGDKRSAAPSDFNDSGTAARFFYTAKADKADRLGSKHPTVKPVDLMAYLCRLITPPGGTVLDPFAGSGTTAMACLREGFNAILIEREARYVVDIERRLAHVEGADTPLFARDN